MPENWKTYKLGELIDINSNQIKKGDLSWINYIDIKSVGTGYYEVPLKLNFDDAPSRARRKLQNGDTVISSVRPNLKSFFYCRDIPENAIASTGFAVLSAKNIEPRYLYYLTTNDEYINFLVQSCSGSAYPAFSPKVILDSTVTIPPLQEQKAIASILSALDDKIELNLQMNKTLEEMANISFRQWFIEEIGDDWESISLKDLIEIRGGFSYKGEFIGSGSSLLLGMGCVSFSNRFLSSGARQYSGECNLTHLVKPGDLVIATRQQSDNMPILGFPAIIPVSLDGKKVIVGTNLYRVINNSHFSNNLLFQLMRSTEYQNHILANSKGSTVRMITKDAIELFEFKIPPLSLLEKYDKEITGFGVQIEHNMMENQTLTTFRDTLLPKLISGGVRVKDAEEMVSASL